MRAQICPRLVTVLSISGINHCKILIYQSQKMSEHIKFEKLLRNAEIPHFLLSRRNPSLFFQIICIIQFFFVTLRSQRFNMSTQSYISQLSPVLFWDIDREQMDVERHSAGLIQRVLERGNLQDWRLTRDFYGMDRIVADCKRLRTLDPMALSFICMLSDTKKEDYRCYQFRQSNPTLWNS